MTPSLAAALLLAAAPAAAAPVRFSSPDGIVLSGEFLPPREGRPVFVMLHGVGAGKGEWAAFASSLAARGYGTFAFDARGHGASGGPSFERFRSPYDWVRLESDIEGALRYLEGRGHPRERAPLVGASIGANIVARVAAKDGRVPFVVLLSPGEDYRGITVREALETLRRPALLAASADDPYSLESCRALLKGAGAGGRTFIEAVSGHGAQMLEEHRAPGFTRALLRWIEEAVRTSSSRRRKGPADGSSGTPSSPAGSRAP